MKILKILNPKGWIGQIALIVSIIGGSFVYGLYKGQQGCPPQEINNTEINAKSKKNGIVSITPQDQTDCLEWLKTLSNKDIKNLKKAH